MEKVVKQLSMHQHQRGLFGRDWANNGAKNPNLNLSTFLINVLCFS